MNTVTLAPHTPHDMLIRWQRGLINHFGEYVETDPYFCALLNLLDAQDWRGSARQVVEAVPENDGFGLEELRNTLARLGLRTIKIKMSHRRLSDALCPCLHIGGGNTAPTVVIRRQGRDFVLAPQTGIEVETVAKSLPRGGTFLIVEPIGQEEREERGGSNDPAGAKRWLGALVAEFKQVIIWAFILALIVNLLSLAGPLSIMVIYDQVIAKESLETLDWLLLGVGVAALFEIGLRVLRARCQAYVGAKLDYQVGIKVFQQVLHLPPLLTERAPVGGQVTRIREFDSFREIFSGPIAGIALDLPFTIIFVGILFWIGGPLALVPVVLGLIYFLLARGIAPVLRERTRRAGKARSNRHTFLVELMWGMRSIKKTIGPGVWRERFRHASANAAWANFEVSRLHSGSTALAQSIMFIAGATTLGFGVLMVNAGDMTLGALIATMMLVWRILGPIQTLFGLANRLEQLRQSFRQLTEMLSYRREQEPDQSPSTPLRFHGQLTFSRVSMRYGAGTNPALLGVSFAIEPGEIVGIAGDSGAGKSTLAKLALGLYQPQGGAINLDGIDLRQLRPITLRQTLGYVPQKNHAFPGSILDNIRLADPTASLHRVREACKMAGLLHKIEALPGGFDTEFRDGLHTQIPQGFLRQMALARAFLVDAPVYILDEPTSGMDEEDERFFLRALEVLRDHKTVLMVTQRPSHMLLCDKLVYLEDGQLRYFGEPEKVLDAVHADTLAAQDVLEGRVGAGQARLTSQ